LPHHLARHAEWLLARGDELHARALAQQRLRELAACVQLMLTGVEDQQQPAAAQRASERYVPAGCHRSADPKRLRNALGNELGCGHGRDVDQPHTVCEGAASCDGEAHRETGFPDAAGTNQRDQPRRPRERAQLLQCRLAPDEAGDFYW
jgi:hypothetical protein